MEIPANIEPKSNYEVRASLPSSYALYVSIDRDRFNIKFNYEFDESGFFDELKKSALDEAARIWSDILYDGFPDINVGTNLLITPPSGKTFTSVANKIIDDLVINVGAGKLDDDEYAETSSSVSFIGPTLLPDSLSRRLIGDNYQPWTSGIHFNKDSNFFYDFNKDVPKDKVDFLTVALHEIGHALGMGAVLSSALSRLIANNEVKLDFGHVTGSEEDLMYPSIDKGKRKLPSKDDKKILMAFGYHIN